MRARQVNDGNPIAVSTNAPTAALGINIQSVPDAHGVDESHDLGRHVLHGFCGTSVLAAIHILGFTVGAGAIVSAFWAILKYFVGDWVKILERRSLSLLPVLEPGR